MCWGCGKPGIAPGFPVFSILLLEALGERREHCMGYAEELAALKKYRDATSYGSLKPKPKIAHF